MNSKYLPFITLVLGLTIGILIPSPINQIITSKEIRQPSQYRFINPLLECDNSASVNQDANLYRLKEKILHIIDDLQKQKKAGFISVYFRDLNNGPWFGINEKENFSPASLIKIHMMIAYFKLAEIDPTILDLEIKNTESAAVKMQDIPPSKPLTPDQNYTVSQLINRMIIDSDNSAHELLFNHIDAQTLNEVYQNLNIDSEKAKGNPGGNIISVKDYASALRILYNASYLNRTMSEKALELLSQTKYNQALAAGIPQNIVVSHKFGERQYSNNEKQLHDCGIIYLPDKPYLLCLMTRGQNFDQLAESIKIISRTIYQHLSSP